MPRTLPSPFFGADATLGEARFAVSLVCLANDGAGQSAYRPCCEPYRWSITQVLRNLNWPYNLLAVRTG